MRNAAVRNGRLLQGGASQARGRSTHRSPDDRLEAQPPITIFGASHRNGNLEKGMTYEMKVSDERAARAECQHLIALASWLGDIGDAAGFAQCFTEDCVFDRGGDIISGRAAVLKYVAARPSLVRVRHINALPLIELLDAHSASGVILSTVWRVGVDGLANTVMAETRDEYRHTSDGWRIAKRTARQLS
jgi:hypothetical protein